MTTITLQATGDLPITFEGERIAHAKALLDGDKRGVELRLFRDTAGLYYAELTYLTHWGQERPVTKLGAFPDLRRFANWARELAKDILPPGAGFPATPTYETRQAKLAGTMETLTLHCLTDVLRQAADKE